MKIILGTSSKQRQAAFWEWGYEDFEIMAADIDEKAIRSNDPATLTVELAKTKAAAIQKKIMYPALLVTADQVIVWNGVIREKPESEEQAWEYLLTCHEGDIRIVNGIAATNTAMGKQATGNDAMLVRFHRIPKEVIRQAIQTGSVFSWAGGFAVEDPVFIPYVAHAEGEQGSSRGLPRRLTECLMREVSDRRIAP